MTSKFLIPLKLLNITATPANPTAGFVSLYMKNNYLTSLSSSGVVLDVVLDRPLTGFVSITPAQIVATDTVLIAFEKIQAQINNISSGQSDEYYQDLIFNAITAGTGISVNYNDAGNAFTISSTITQGPTGSGTNNFVAKWTPNGTTLGNSLIQDNGTTIGIGASLNATIKVNVSSGGTSSIAGWFRATGSTAYEQGLVGEASSTGTMNIGIEGRAINTNANTNIGGWFRANSGGANYALQLQDGTEAAGKFLKSINSNGYANWATLTTADISGYTTYTLPTATSSILGGVKIGSGLTITSGIVSVTPTSSYAEVITFDQLTPTTAGVVFSPNTPATTGLLYVSGINSSTWIWNGTAYVTENVTSTIGTAWFLASAPAVDAGASKTADILRSGSLNIQGTYSGNAGLTTIRPGNVYVSGDGNNTGRLEIRRRVDDATQNGAPALYFSRMRGTGGTTSYPLAGDSYGLIGFSSAGNIEVVGVENYGASARGSDMIFRVGALGAGSELERLRILQNGKLKINNAYSLPNADGTVSQVLSTNGAGVVSWVTIAAGSTLAGSGITDYVARWTPNGTTLGTGLIRDNGTSVAIDSSPVANYKFFVTTTTQLYALNAENKFIGTQNQFGILGISQGIGGTGQNIGVNGEASGNTQINIGGTFSATGASLGTNIGLTGFAQGGALNYAIQLRDGTEGVGKFLKSIDVYGKAHWASITAADIAGGVAGGSGTTDYVARWTSSSALGIGVIQDNSSSIAMLSGSLSTGVGVNVASSTFNLLTQFVNSKNGGLGSWISSSGVGALENVGSKIIALGSTLANTGARIEASGTGTTNIALKAVSAGGTTNYALQLFDGSQGINRFLKSFTAIGEANWETSFTIDSNKIARFDGQIVSVLSTNSIPLGTTQTINWNNGNSQTMNLGSATGNVALTFTNPVQGATYFLRIVQGATPRQISFSTVVKFPGGTAPTLTATASAVDTIVIFYDGTSYFGNYSLNYI